MNTTDVERAARAMWKTEMERFPDSVREWETLPADIQDVWRVRARAAIAALGQTDGHSWQPISTAKLDGSMKEVYWQNQQVSLEELTEDRIDALKQMGAIYWRDFDCPAPPENTS